MKKRFLAALLAAVMALCLLPSAALAAPASSVTLGGVTLNVGTPYYKNGESAATAMADPTGYNARFDPGTGTLYLDGLEITGYAGECIAATGDLILDLTGINTVSTADASSANAIDITGSLTVRGAGSLSATAHGASDGTGGKGVHVGGNLSVTSGSLTGMGGAASSTSTPVSTEGEVSALPSRDSYGVYAGTAITVSGGSLSGTGGAANSSISLEDESGNFLLLSCDSYGVYAHTAITASGGSLSGTGGATTSPRIGDNGLGDGVDFNCDSYGVYAQTGGVEALGTGSLTGAGGATQNGRSWGVCAHTGIITVSGGSLTGTGGAIIFTEEGESSYAPSSRGVCADFASIQVSGGSLTGAGGATVTDTAAKYQESCGVYAHTSITVSGGSLTGAGGTAMGPSYGVCADADSIQVSGGSLTGTGGAIDQRSDSAVCMSCGVFARVAASGPDGGKIEVSGTGTLTATGAEGPVSYGMWAYNGVTVSGGAVMATAGTARGDRSCGVFVFVGDLRVSGGALTATGGPCGTGSSCGVWLDTPSKAVTLTGGATIAKGGAAATSQAFTGQPLFGDPNTWYRWRTAEGGEYKLSGTEQYGWDVTPKHTYAEIRPNDPILSPESLPGGTVGAAYSQTITATGSDPVTLSVLGSLPSWLTFDPSTGVVSGTPTAAGSYTFTVRAAFGSKADTRWYTIVVSEPTAPSGGDPFPNAVYNGPRTVWLTGSGLDTNDQLITQTLSSGQDYKALLRLASGGDVFKGYNIYLRSGRTSTGRAMYLHFDLSAKYAGQVFTLVHKKADGTYETFYAMADSNGDVTFGPLFELSPFLLVKGRLDSGLLSVPQTGSAAPGTWTGMGLAALAVLLAACLYSRTVFHFPLRKRRV